jgi:hypothetical protein
MRAKDFGELSVKSMASMAFEGAILDEPSARYHLRDEKQVVAWSITFDLTLLAADAARAIDGAFAARARAGSGSVTEPNPDAELIELGRQFVELARHRDAANDESARLYDVASRSYPPGTWDDACLRGPAASAAYRAAVDAADEAAGLHAAEAEFDLAMDQLRATFVRMISMRPTPIEGMRALA